MQLAIQLEEAANELIHTIIMMHGTTCYHLFGRQSQRKKERKKLDFVSTNNIIDMLEPRLIIFPINLYGTLAPFSHLNTEKSSSRLYV